MKWKLFLGVVFSVLFSIDGLSQVKAFDNLEMLYAQGNYGMVYRRSNRLLDNPEYDFSEVPSFYKSLALFQLSQRDLWYNRKPESLEEAKKLFTQVKKSPSGARIFAAHMHEISDLKKDLQAWGEDLKRKKEIQAYENLQAILDGLFDQIPDLDKDSRVDPKEINLEINTNESVSVQNFRTNLMSDAKKQMGVPYVWAGNDPKGFDCSGFTSYVLKQQGKEIPRRAVDQFEASRKIKQNKVQPGDLVFFDSGAGINHVGMIVSKQGEPLMMIHASSSQGIVITDIEKSSYWSKRLVGFGTFVSGE